MGIQLVIGFLNLFKGSLGQNLEDGWGMNIRSWVPLWFSSMIVNFNNLSSLMLSILFVFSFNYYE